MKKMSDSRLIVLGRYMAVFKLHILLTGNIEKHDENSGLNKLKLLQTEFGEFNAKLLICMPVKGQPFDESFDMPKVIINRVRLILDDLQKFMPCLSYAELIEWIDSNLLLQFNKNINFRDLLRGFDHEKKCINQWRSLAYFCRHNEIHSSHLSILLNSSGCATRRYLSGRTTVTPNILSKLYQFSTIELDQAKKQHAQARQEYHFSRVKSQHVAA